jgi:hypothetical protein
MWEQVLQQLLKTKIKTRHKLSKTKTENQGYVAIELAMHTQTQLLLSSSLFG